MARSNAAICQYKLFSLAVSEANPPNLIPSKFWLCSTLFLVHTIYNIVALTVPTLLSVRRISGSSAAVDWTPLTQDEARGLLTSLEIAYEPVLDTTPNCSNTEFVDSETIFVRENLFEQSSANITGLELNREYCIAIRVRTSGGDSRFSSSIRLSCKMFHKFIDYLKNCTITYTGSTRRNSVPD